MGRLAGFTAAEVIRKLRRAGFVYDRQAKGSHEIWLNLATGARTTSQIIPVICRKGLSGRLSGKPG